MANDYPLENLLRPAHELAPAIAYWAATVIVLLTPSVLMGAVHTPWLTYSLATCLFIRGATRFHAGAKLLRYQYELFVLPEYSLSSNDIPKDPKKLFLGLGFEWEARHTQRRYDIERVEFNPIRDKMKRKPTTLLYRYARAYESTINSFIETLTTLSWVKRLLTAVTLSSVLSWRSWANPVAPIPYVEGLSAIHAVGLWEGEESVNLMQSERVAHAFVVGTTRVGKTRLAEVLITQDIHAGHTTIVFDPKGDADLLKRIHIEAVKAGREQDFICFHLGYPEVSARYNPIGTFGRITEPASRIASQLPGEGSSAAFREFTWRYVNVMSKTLTSLGKSISYDSLLKYGADIDPLLNEYIEHLFSQPKHQGTLKRAGILDWNKAITDVEKDENQKMSRQEKGRDRRAWAAVQVYRSSGIRDEVASALIKTFEYEKSFYDKLVASLFPLLEKLTSGPTAELLSPDYFDLDDERPIFDWDDVIRQGGIVYIGLDALSDAEVAQAVGNSMFSDLTSRAGAIYKHGSHRGLPSDIAAKSPQRKICLHADEFNELVGKEFIPMANKAGGAGFQLTVYTQTLSDIVARFKDQAMAGQVIGNLGSIVMLRVKELATARLLTDLLPNVEVDSLTALSGAQDDSNPDSPVDFTSGTQQRRTRKDQPLINDSDLTRLPKGQAFAMLGGRVHKIRLPLFSNEDELPNDLQFLYQHMRKQYREASNDKWFVTPSLDLGGTA